jgi:hypothetical protein
LGNNTLYKTNERQIPRIRKAIRNLQLLAHPPQKSKVGGISGELAKVRAENAELRRTTFALTADLIQKGYDWEEERSLRIHYEQKLAELGYAAPRQLVTAASKTPGSGDLRASVIDITDHREREKPRERKRRNRAGTPPLEVS